MCPKSGRAKRQKWVLYDFGSRERDEREKEEFVEAREAVTRIRKRDRRFTERPRRGCRKKQNLKRRLRRIQERGF
ncbi:MAG: hypothetical protein Kow0099_16180 [Candidatus Abyssubacteria bacterium]